MEGSVISDREKSMHGDPEKAELKTRKARPGSLHQDPGSPDAAHISPIPTQSRTEDGAWHNSLSGLGSVLRQEAYSRMAKRSPVQRSEDGHGCRQGNSARVPATSDLPHCEQASCLWSAGTRPGLRGSSTTSCGAMRLTLLLLS